MRVRLDHPRRSLGGRLAQLEIFIFVPIAILEKPGPQARQTQHATLVCHGPDWANLEPLEETYAMRGSTTLESYKNRKVQHEDLVLAG
jgi:hypothetical protein